MFSGRKKEISKAMPEELSLEMLNCRWKVSSGLRSQRDKRVTEFVRSLSKGFLLENHVFSANDIF